ncbi:MAG: WXG100 family type VII secretion target [Acidimicrobiales bacterium]
MTIPGDPGAVRSLAEAIGDVGSAFGAAGSSITNAAASVVSGSWEGVAATAFGSAVDYVRELDTSASSSHHRVGEALHAYASALQHAKDLSEQADRARRAAQSNEDALQGDIDPRRAEQVAERIDTFTARAEGLENEAQAILEAAADAVIGTLDAEAAVARQIPSADNFGQVIEGLVLADMNGVSAGGHLDDLIDRMIDQDQGRGNGVGGDIAEALSPLVDPNRPFGQPVPEDEVARAVEAILASVDPADLDDPVFMSGLLMGLGPEAFLLFERFVDYHPGLSRFQVVPTAALAYSAAFRETEDVQRRLAAAAGTTQLTRIVTSAPPNLYSDVFYVASGERFIDAWHAGEADGPIGAGLEAIAVSGPTAANQLLRDAGWTTRLFEAAYETGMTGFREGGDAGGFAAIIVTGTSEAGRNALSADAIRAALNNLGEAVEAFELPYDSMREYWHIVADGLNVAYTNNIDLVSGAALLQPQPDTFDMADVHAIQVEIFAYDDLRADAERATMAEITRLIGNAANFETGPLRSWGSYAGALAELSARSYNEVVVGEAADDISGRRLLGNAVIGLLSETTGDAVGGVLTAISEHRFEDIVEHAEELGIGFRTDINADVDDAMVYLAYENALDVPEGDPNFTVAHNLVTHVQTDFDRLIRPDGHMIRPGMNADLDDLYDQIHHPEGITERGADPGDEGTAATKAILDGIESEISLGATYVEDHLGVAGG